MSHNITIMCLGWSLFSTSILNFPPSFSYILDGVMDETHGLRPFDLDAFRANDKRQPLYVIASAVSDGGKGTMETGERLVATPCGCLLFIVILFIIFASCDSCIQFEGW